MSSVPAWLNSSSFSPRAKRAPEIPAPAPPLLDALAERSNPLQQASSSGQQEESTSPEAFDDGGSISARVALFNVEVWCSLEFS
jgi:hypothetical protein